MSILRVVPRLVLLAALSLLAATGVHAQDASPGGDLLPVTKAFALKATIDKPGSIALHWDIAPHYYLYRGRVETRILTPGVEAGALQMPPGEKEHDPYLGDVEIYHGSLDAHLPYTAPGSTPAELKVAVTYQGCHEIDPKICYPPHTETLVLPVPQAAAATPSPEKRMPQPGARGLAAASGKFLTLPGMASGKPLPPEQAFPFDAIASSPTQLLLRWTMPQGYYIYRDRVTLKLDDPAGASLGKPAWPPGVTHEDEYFGKQVVYFGEVDLPVPLLRDAAGTAHAAKLRVSFQGCQDGGICYPPVERTIDINLPAAASTQLAATPPPGTSPPSDTGGRSAVDKLAASLAGKGRWLALLGFFGAGLLLAFTPCVLPMIPILTGLIAGGGHRLSAGRAFSLSLVYVLATCVVFTIAGVVAGLAGANLAAAMQKPWVLVAFALLFVLLALSMFGLYELQLPASWQARLAGASNRQQGGSFTGVAVMGVLSALIVGPCVAPPLAAAVLYIGQTRDPVFGGAALFALSFGMGIPLLAFGTAAGRWLPRTGAWMTAVKVLFGFVFLALAIWMLSRVLAMPWILALSGALLVGLAAWLLASLRHGASGWRIAAAAVGAIAFVVGASELVGAAAGSQNLLRPLAGLVGGAPAEAAPLPFRRVKSVADVQRAVAQASADGRPVMLDFYADWCVSCKEMEHLTLSRPEVRDALSRFVLLQADVTANDDDDKALLKQYGLFGPPATLFFGDNGREQRALRLIGFENAGKFVARLAEVK